MLTTPLLLVHVCAAMIGLISGYVALFVRKGGGLHHVAGAIFVVSMLMMSGSAAIVASLLRPVMINVIAGMLTFYLVCTSWRAAKRRQGGVTLFDLGAFLFAAMVGVAGIASGIEAARSPNGLKDQMPGTVYFIFGSVAILFAASDVHMLLRGGVTGAQRIARHFWRMCFALLIATLSAYPGQAKLFPKAIRATNLLYVPHVLLIGAMFFWLARIRSRKRPQRVTSIRIEENDIRGAAA